MLTREDEVRNEPQFKKEDVWAVAQAIEDSWRSYGGDSPDYCSYCGMEFHWKTGNDAQHKPDCVVLIARDLLTRAAPDERGTG